MRRRHNKTSDTPLSLQPIVNRVEDNSPAIRQEESSSSRIGQLTPQLESLHCADDRILARWKDGQWYPGTIQEKLSNGKYVCNFC